MRKASTNELVKANEAAIEAWAHRNRGAISYNGGTRPEWELARHFYLGMWVLISRGAHAGKFGIATRHIESKAPRGSDPVMGRDPTPRRNLVEIITSTGERVRCDQRSVSRLHVEGCGITGEALADAEIAVCHTAKIDRSDLFTARQREIDARSGRLFTSDIASGRDHTVEHRQIVRDLDRRGEALRASWFQLSERLGLAANLPRGKSTRLFWADFAAWVIACGEAKARLSDAFAGALH